MPMPKETFEGERLREVAEKHQVNVEGLTDEEICQRCYEATKDRDIIGAFEYKHRSGWEQWNEAQWDETLRDTDTQRALRNPLIRTKHFQRVSTAVKETFPQFEDCYDQSFALCLVVITDGEQEKMKSALEQLAEFHSGHASKEELSCGGDGYTGEMLHALYKMGQINI